MSDPGLDSIQDVAPVVDGFLPVPLREAPAVWRGSDEVDDDGPGACVAYEAVLGREEGGRVGGQDRGCRDGGGEGVVSVEEQCRFGIDGAAGR